MDRGAGAGTIHLETIAALGPAAGALERIVGRFGGRAAGRVHDRGGARGGGLVELRRGGVEARPVADLRLWSGRGGAFSAPARRGHVARVLPGPQGKNQSSSSARGG